jgi:UDP-glucose 4-epimerase
MHILITGGSGFIGSYMLDNFLRRGYQVGVLDKSVPAHFAELSRRVDLYLADITFPLQVSLRCPYDTMIHLAAANDIVSKNALDALKITTYGTKMVLDFCVKHNLRKFIYFSTFQVYGQDSGLIDECTPVSCKNDYALSHYFAEEYIRLYQRRHGLDFIIVRPTNIYGAFLHRDIDRWSLVPNCFCREAVERQTITLLSSGKQERDFISLEDVTNLTALLCETFDSHKNQVFNLARGKSLSILEVAQLVASQYERLYGKRCTLVTKSDEPKKAEMLTVNTASLQKLYYRYSHEHDLARDIEAIFKLLKEE